MISNNKMVIIDNTFPDNPIYIGKNQLDNDIIITAAKQTDIWFHLANLPSCHVIISCDKKHPVTKKMIKYCAELTKQHTKYRHRKVKVNYTYIKNIRKTNTPGMVHIKRKCMTMLL